MNLKIGSRGSDLALTQSRYVRQLLSEHRVHAEIVILETRGDRVQDVPLHQLDTANERKGLFTKELEDAMLTGEIQVAVHSFKDLPTAMVPGLVIGAMPQRLSALDALLLPVSKQKRRELPILAPGAYIGTSSVRRAAQIQYLWPDLNTASIRGNLPTRIRKLLVNNEYDAILLAQAGLLRLGYLTDVAASATGTDASNEPQILPLQLPDELAALLPPGEELIAVLLPPQQFVPAPAQGALGVQCRADDSKVRKLLSGIHDAAAEECLRAERTILSELEGGCHLPLGAFCEKSTDGYGMHIFLGADAPENRRRKSFRIFRQGRNIELLTRQILAEIKTSPPIVLSGRADRVAELVRAYPQKNLLPLPLLQIQPIQGDDTLRTLKAWRGDLIAAFSVSGVRALSEQLAEFGLAQPEADWAVTGSRTADAVRSLFPAARVRHLSPDGTGAGLARKLLEEKLSTQTLALAAENGREEFFQIMAAAERDVLRLPLYRSIRLTPEAETFMNLPDECYIVFASPSAGEAFFDLCEQYKILEEKEAGFRYCALGPTTARAVHERGRTVYAQAREVDLNQFIEDLS